MAGPPRIVSLEVKNYRALADVRFENLSPLTVLLGPNGTGKSTVFDVFAFLSECFNSGLRRAWDKRGRFRELRTRGGEGPIRIELKYKETADAPIITYALEIDELDGRPIVAQETLRWRRGHQYGKPYKFLDFSMGKGEVISGEAPEQEDERIHEALESPDFLAVSTLGQLAKHPRVAALRRFITGWHLSYLSTQDARGTPDAGPQERLSKTGDNLANVIQFLKETHPTRLDQILHILAQRVPLVERVDSELMADGRLLLQFKDGPFARPILAKYASDGTLKMLAYLTLLHDPNPPKLVGIEEPENFLHPRLLQELAEECLIASENTQLMVTTHSPYFVNGLQPQHVRVLYRDETGCTVARSAENIPGVRELMDAGALLGDVWMEGHFGIGDPLTRHGRPRR